MTPAAVEARGWGWRHAGRRAWAVRDLDLSIPAGQRVLLLGALLIDGLAAHEARHRTGLLLQDPDTQLVMTRSGDDVAFGPECHGVPAEEIWPQVDEAMRAVGFGYGRERGTVALSGGEKQRLALAGQLANRPGLLLLDEPTANLDPDGAAVVRAAVAAVGDCTLVLVEHRVEAWLGIIDRVVVLGSAGLLADGAPRQVFAEHGAALRAAGVWVPGAIESDPPHQVGPGSEVLRGAQVSFRYRGAGADAVHPTSLSLRAGEAVAVTGANGSGKTSLAMLVAGLATPRSGKVTAPDSARPLHRRRAASLIRAVGTVFQQPEHQFLRPTVRAELLQAPLRLGWPAARAGARADELLQRLGLAALAEANPYTLSGGQQRRLSVATALSGTPPVLVLDEPTFGQDARTWRELLELLRAVRNEGTAILAVSHDAAFVDGLADRRLRMAAGKVF